MRRSAHLSDDRLVEVCFDGLPTSVEHQHFEVCGQCRDRRARLERLLSDASDAAEAEADAAFPPERLAAQHARILHRIEQDGRPARVIAFPAALVPESVPLRSRPAARWIAGAAAAGLAIGLLAGHLAHDLPAFGRPSRTPAVRTVASRPGGQPAIRAVNASLNDEQLIIEIESAIQGPTLAVLRPLHDLTPQ